MDHSRGGHGTTAASVGTDFARQDNLAPGCAVGMAPPRPHPGRARQLSAKSIAFLARLFLR